MAKPEWGTKRICQSCNTPFYDLRRDPIVCPKCESVYDPEAILKSRRSKGPEEVVEEKPKEKAEEEVELEEDEDALADDGGDEVIEDTNDIDDEDVSSVFETGSDDNEET